nr:hypothetical protein [uncultured Allomuricauda sp.]
MTERSKKNLGWLYKGIVLAALGAIVTYLVAFVPKSVDAVNNRTFTTTEQRVKIEEFEHDWLNNGRLERVEQAAEKPLVDMAKKEMDSIYVQRNEYEELVKNMAIDNYNQKRVMDRLLENDEELKKVMDIMILKIGEQ